MDTLRERQELEDAVGLGRRAVARLVARAAPPAAVLRRVGINALYLVPGEVGGTEIYARELVGALAEQHPDVGFTVFAGVEAAPSLRAAGWPGNVRVWQLPGALPRQAAAHRRRARPAAGGGRGAPGSSSCTASARRRRCTAAACAS